jgi:hypothetical protein
MGNFQRIPEASESKVGERKHGSRYAAPAPAGEAPTTPHERTASIDAYTQEHLRHIDELRALFPLMHEECGCSACLAIHLLFTKKQRRWRWPNRGTARAHLMVPVPPR